MDFAMFVSLLLWRKPHTAARAQIPPFCPEFLAMNFSLRLAWQGKLHTKAICNAIASWIARWAVQLLPSQCVINARGLVHDNAHVWVLTVADCLSSNRKRVRCTQINVQNSNTLFATREYFRASGLIYIFLYVAADKNKIYSPVLLWNKHLSKCIFTRSYPR